MINALNSPILFRPIAANPNGNAGREAGSFSSSIGSARNEGKSNPDPGNGPVGATPPRPQPGADPTYSVNRSNPPSPSANVRRPNEESSAAGRDGNKLKRGQPPQTQDQAKLGAARKPVGAEGKAEAKAEAKLEPKAQARPAETDEFLTFDIEPGRNPSPRGFAMPAPDLGPDLPAPWPQPESAQTQLRTAPDGSEGAEALTPALKPGPGSPAEASRRQQMSDAAAHLQAHGGGPSARTQPALQRAAEDALRVASGGPRGTLRADPTTPGVTLPIAHDALDPRLPGAAQSGFGGAAGNNGSNSGSGSSNGSGSESGTGGQKGLGLLGAAGGSVATGLPLTGAATSFAQALAAADPLAGNPSLSEASLQASPGSPEFAAQASVQLTVFVREGVQHARLHLHPAEMGPVTVQIQLDGQAAQIHLAAENAQTRQALQDALPQLASNLREAGLSLSGGGVFEQPRQSGQESAAAQQRDGNNGNGNGNGNGNRITAASNGLDASINLDTHGLSNHTARRGIVDLVA